MAIVDRFIHIDADFVSATSRLTPEGGEAEVVVSFYPCWEHPLYKAALSRGERWAGGSSKAEPGMRCRDNGDEDATGWWFVIGFGGPS